MRTQEEIRDIMKRINMKQIKDDEEGRYLDVRVAGAELDVLRWVLCEVCHMDYRIRKNDV